MINVKLSKAFKIQATKAIFSIFLFILVYLLLLIFAIGITALSIYGGVMLIISFPRFITIALGIGLASFGFFILIFLIKFIFKSNKVDRSHLYEIKKQDEPQLFELIEKTVKSVGTKFPKKVYLSADVNASVFYDSSFWSMFFPVRKNLQIGLGLVNTVSKLELQAILAHEFGHFSQRSMKVGSYVYNLNHIIYNMLYDNDSYNDMMERWAEVSTYFSIFLVIASAIVQGIQAILKSLYNVINKSYMALSREMEFHADEIAANVTGYKALKNSLLRMSLAYHTYNATLNFYDDKIKHNLMATNLFLDQDFVMQHIVKDSDLPEVNGIPEVSLEYLSRFNKSKLIVKDQWASHPSTNERIERLEQIGIPSVSEEIVVPANSIFVDANEIQETITNKLFETVEYKEQPQKLSHEIFKQEYEKLYDQNSFPKLYNGYYDNKNFTEFDTDNTSFSKSISGPNVLFSNEKVELVYNVQALEADIIALEQIKNKTFKIKTFDYDGKKYKQKESEQLLTRLKKELEQVNQEIHKNDLAIYTFFKEKEKTPELSQLKILYQDFFDFDKLYEEKQTIYNELANALDFINYTTPFEDIRRNFQRVTPLELKLKHEIKELLANEVYSKHFDEEVKENFKLYLKEPLTYFGNQMYFDNNLGVLFKAMNDYMNALNNHYFSLKKKVLIYQESLLK